MVSPFFGKSRPETFSQADFPFFTTSRNVFS